MNSFVNSYNNNNSNNIKKNKREYPDSLTQKIKKLKIEETLLNNSNGSNVIDSISNNESYENKEINKSIYKLQQVIKRLISKSELLKENNVSWFSSINEIQIEIGIIEGIIEEYIRLINKNSNNM